MCSGDTILLTSNNQINATDFGYSWYLGGTTTTALSTITPALNTSYTVSYTKPGTYTLLVFDQKFPNQTSCQKTANVTISASPAPSYTISGGGSYCSDKTAPAVNITFNGTAPFKFDWSDGTTNTAVLSTSLNPYVITPTGNGTYSVTAISDANCVGKITDPTVTVQKIQTPDLKWDKSDSIYCIGNNNTSLNATIVSPATASGGYTYAWRNLTDNSNITNNSNILSAPTGTKTYSLTVSDAVGATTCTQVLRSRVITANPLPTYSISGGGTFCSTDPITPVVITIGAGNPPYKLTYSDGDGVNHTVSVNGPNPASYTVPEKVDGTYQVLSINDASQDSCGATIDATKTAKITINTSTTTTAVAQVPFCAGTVNSLTLASLFTFNPTGQKIVYTCSTPAAINTTNFLNLSTPGTYTITATYGDNCPSITTNKVTVYALPTINAGADISVCINTDAPFTASTSGGQANYTYVWSPSTNLTGSTTEDPIFKSSIAGTTTYNVTVTDANNCIGTDKIAVTANGLPTVTAGSSPAAICLGSSSTISGGGANSYVWSSGQTTASFSVSPTASTSYSVTGTDVNGCKNTAQTSVTVNGIPTISVNVPALDISSGNYCVSNTSPLAITTTSNPNGGTVTLSGPGVSGTSFTPSVAGTGSYTITMNYTDLNGCKNSATTTATVTALPTVSWASANPTLVCSDGVNTTLNITVLPNATGGTGSFTLFTGLSKASETSATLNPVTAGAGVKTLSYDYVDSKGCKASAGSSITVQDTPEPLTKTISTLSYPIPAVGTFFFDVTDQNLQNVKWYNSPKTPVVLGTGNTYEPVTPHTNTTPDSLVAGTYPYSITQTINGCESQPITLYEIITNCPAQAPVPDPDPKPCTAASLSTILKVKNGGTGTGVIHWFNNMNLKDPATKDLNQGLSYTVTSTQPQTYPYYVAEYDAVNKCYGPISPVVLTIMPLPTVSWASANPTLVCSDGTTVTLNVDVQPGTTDGTGSFVTFTGLSKASESSATLNPVTAGVGTKALSYEFTDKNGCKASATSSIEVYDTPEPLTKTISTLSYPIPTPGTFIFDISDQNLKDVKWYNSPKTAVVLGTGNTYEPVIPHTNTSPDSLVAGTYPYNITQTIHGCESQPVVMEVIISKCPALAPEVDPDPKPCTAASLSTLLKVKNGGTGTGVIHWFDQSNIKDANTKDLNQGLTYTVTATDPGSYPYYVAEYDAVNKCYGPTSPVLLTIMPLPTVSWASANPTLVCSDGVSVTLNVDVQPGIAGGTGSFVTFTGLSKASESSSTLDPVTAGAGTKALSYEFTDKNGCKASATSSIEVYNTPEPKEIDITTISTPVPDPGKFIFDVTDQSLKDVKWYNSPKTTAVLGTGNIYEPSIPHTNTNPDSLIAKCYDYLYTQTISGCESQPVLAHACVTNCPAKAPAPDPVTNPCTAASLSTMLGAKTTGGGTGPIHWFDGPDTKKAKDIHTGSTYTVTETTPKTYPYYVAEYDVANKCFSPTTLVSFTINPLPTPVISAVKTDVCYTSGIQNLNVSPTSGGVLTGKGAVSTDKFDPTVGGKTDGSYELTYTVTDGNGCIDSAKLTMNVTFADAPVDDPKQPYLILDIPPNGKTAPELCVTKGNGSGTGLEWANDANFSSPIAGANALCFDTKYTQTVTAKAYYARQTENGCKSEATPSYLTITDCPWAKPGVVNVDLCENDKSLSNSVLKATTSESGVTWQWYTDAGTTTPASGSGNNTDSYNPGGTVAGSITYYVRYQKVEPKSKISCWSPASAGVRIINPKPTPEIDTLTVKNDYCYTQALINLKGYDKNGLSGTDVFKVDGSINGLNVITVGNPTADRSYSVEYVRTSDKNCKDSVTKTINIHYVAKPVTTEFNYKVIGVGALPTISATPSPATNSIQWYNGSKTILSAQTASILTGSAKEPKADSVANYFATQSDAWGCKSDYSSTRIVYQTCKASAPIKKDTAMCTYDQVPPMIIKRGLSSITAHTWQYEVYSPYDPASTLGQGANPIATVTSASGVFDPTNVVNKTITGSKQFWIREFDLTDKCAGPATEMLLVIKSTGTPTPAMPLALCEKTIGSTTMQVSGILGGADVYWYDSTATTAAEALNGKHSFKGNPYTATGVNSLKEGTYRYFVSQFTGGCQSEKISMSFRVNDKPVLPVLKPDSSCQFLTYKAMSATGVPNAKFSWYTMANPVVKTSPTVSDQDTYTPTTATASNPGYTSFYVIQTSPDGCYSDPQEVRYRLFPKPAKPVFVRQTQSICDYTSVAPAFALTNGTSTGTITWNAAGTISIGPTHTPVVPVKGTAASVSFSVTQEENTCVSDPETGTLILIPQPAIPRTGSDKTICYDAPAPVITAEPSSGSFLKWYTDAHDVKSSNYTLGNDLNTTGLYAIPQTVGEAAKKTSFFVTQSVKGTGYECESEPATITITVHSKPAPPRFFNGDSILLLCYNDDPTKLVMDTRGSNFQWYDKDGVKLDAADGTVNGNSFLPVKTVLTPRAVLEYHITQKNNAGCESDPTTGFIKVSPSFITPLMITDMAPYCYKQGQPKLFEVFAQGNKFDWKITRQGNTIISVQDTNVSKISFTPPGTGDYNIDFFSTIVFSDPAVSQIKECKGGEGHFTQLVRPVPHITVRGDQLICEKTTKEFYRIDTLTDSTDVITWKITNNRTMYSPATGKNIDLQRQIDFGAPGYDTIYVREWNGSCADTAILPIKVSPHAIPDFSWEIKPGTRKVLFTNTTEHPIILQGEQSDTVQFNYFIWNYGKENTPLFKQSDSSYLALEELAQLYKYGYYDVKIKSVNEYCIDSTTKKIFVDMEEGLFIPTSFVPESNSPGLARFMPKGYNLETFKIWVYDIWGNLLWYSDKLVNGSPSESWDGTYDGTVMKTDVYIWKVEATFQDGTEWDGQAPAGKNKKSNFGNVLLIR